MADPNHPTETDDEIAPPLSDLIVELLTRTEDSPDSQSQILEELCEAWPSRADGLRAATRNLEAAGWVDIQPLPEQIGEYKPTARIGGGGMGLVFLAEQPSLGRQVAIKRLRTDELFREGARARFQRETEAVARLAHPNIVAVHHVGVDQGAPFLVMDYVKGASLDRIIAAQSGRAPGNLTGDDVRVSIDAELAGMGIASGSNDDCTFEGSWIDVALRVTRDVASALAHAHAHGVLHRDVKPSNVMLTADGRVQLVDFGLATMLDADRLTKSGSFVGSLPYMAPEEFEPGHSPSPRGDIYALGVTLKELLILDLPFPGRGTGRLRKDIEEGRFVNVRSFNPRVSDDLDAVLGMACRRDPGGRYGSASAFAADLTALIEGRPVAARRPGPWAKLKNWARRRPEQAALAGLVGLVAVGAPTGYGVVKGRHADQVVAINEQLKGALKEESEARALAGRHFVQALEALNRVTGQLAEDGLEDEPRMQRARLKIADDALDILAELRSEQPDHPLVIHTWSQFLLVRAEVLFDLGQIDEGLEALELNRTLCRRLAEELPHDRVLAHDSLLAELKVAWGLSHHGRRPESIEIYERAIDDLVDLAVGPQDEGPDFLRLLLDAQSSFAAALFYLDRFEECLGVIGEALPRARTNAEVESADDGPQRILSKLLLVLGDVLSNQGDYAAAEVHYGESADAMRAALALKPGHRDHESRIVLSEMRRAESLSRLHRPNDALECLNRAFQVNDDLRHRFPSLAKFRKRHVSLLNAASFTESMAENYVRAVELGERALEAQIELSTSDGSEPSRGEAFSIAISMGNLSGRVNSCEALGDDRFERAKGYALGALELLDQHDPERKRTRRIAHVVRYNLVLSATGAGDVQGAVGAIEELLSVTRGTPPELRLVADARAEIYAAIMRSDSTPDEESVAFESTLHALESAVRAGFEDHSWFAEEPILDPFRGDPRFVAILEQLAPGD